MQAMLPLTRLYYGVTYTASKTVLDALSQALAVELEGTASRFMRPCIRIARSEVSQDPTEFIPGKGLHTSLSTETGSGMYSPFRARCTSIVARSVSTRNKVAVHSVLCAARRSSAGRRVWLF